MTDRKEQVIALLEGKAEPPTDMIAYLVERATEIKARGGGALKAYNEAVKNAERHHAESTRCYGAINAYAVDIENLLMQHELTAVPELVKKAAE